MAKRDLPRRSFKKRVRSSKDKNSGSPTELATKRSREYVDVLQPTDLATTLSLEHAEVLQQIESVLIDRFQEDPEMDDRAASFAVRATLCDAEPVDRLIADIVEELIAVREFRIEVADEVWRNALSVIDTSIHHHSRLQPGETSYLAFASQFAKTV